MFVKSHQPIVVLHFRGEGQASKLTYIFNIPVCKYQSRENSDSLVIFLTMQLVFTTDGSNAQAFHKKILIVINVKNI